MTSEELINELTSLCKQHLNYGEELKKLNPKTLNWRIEENKWNILECLEHLNLYGDFYIPELKNRIENTNYLSDQNFKSGFLGNYFTKSMMPKEKLNKMKTFNDKDPIGFNLDSAHVLDRFIKQQKALIELLNKSKKVSLNKTKTNITILKKVLKLRIGDTFRFVIYHNQRHIKQIEDILTNHSIIITK